MNLVRDPSPSSCHPALYCWNQSGFPKPREALLQVDPKAPPCKLSDSHEQQKLCREKPHQVELHNCNHRASSSPSEDRSAAKTSGVAHPCSVTSPWLPRHPCGLTALWNILAESPKRPEEPPNLPLSPHHIDFFPQVVGPYRQWPPICQSLTGPLKD